LDLYTKYVFTAPCINETENYEFLELLGDSVINKAIVCHFTQRFPELQCPEGVKTVARLKIKYVSKDTLWKFADSLGFWDFVKASGETRERKKKPTLEDVFEAFCGGTEWIINETFGNHTGYHIIQRFIDKLFQDLPISLDHDDLYDSITRLKELRDYYVSATGKESWHKRHGPEFGRLKYMNNRIVDEHTGYSMQYVTITRQYSKNKNDLYETINNALPPHLRQKFWHALKPEHITAIQSVKVSYQIGGPLAQASAPLLPDAKQKAATIALKNLRHVGLFKR